MTTTPTTTTTTTTTNTNTNTIPTTNTTIPTTTTPTPTTTVLNFNYTCLTLPSCFQVETVIKKHKNELKEKRYKANIGAILSKYIFLQLIFTSKGQYCLLIELFF